MEERKLSREANMVWGIMWYEGLEGNNTTRMLKLGLEQINRMEE